MTKQCPYLTRLTFVYFRKISILCTRTIISPPRLTSVKDQEKLHLEEWRHFSNGQRVQYGAVALTEIKELWENEEHPARQASVISHAALNIIDLTQVNKGFFAVFPIHSAIQFWVVTDIDV